MHFPENDGKKRPTQARRPRAILMLTVLILLATTLSAQAYRDDTSREARQLSGLVLGNDNRPIADADVDYADGPFRVCKTDASGRFALTTSAPVLVIRKTGMRSRAVFLKDASEIRVVLEPERRKPTIQICSNRTKYESIKGFDARLWFPMIAGVKASPQGNDVDYGARYYFVTMEHGTRGIQHASGPMWGFGKPAHDIVWRSVSYDEITYDLGGVTITDARGETEDGKRWRYLGRFLESAAYRDVESEAAVVLDKVLDGACLLPRR
jgi:hypothetical protein